MSGLIKKIIKLCLIVIGVAVVFVVAIAGIFIATFDANQYKQELSDLVRAETGRDLQFHGDVGLTFYPALGMKLGALSLSNAPGFGSEPMIKVNEVSVSVDVASIIAFSPEIDELVLDKLKIDLRKNGKGVTNWDDLVKPNKAQSSDADSASTQSSSGDEPMKISGAFGGLNITNAQLSWVDAQAGAEYQVQNLNLKTGRITPDAPFTLQMQVELESKDEIKADVDLEAQIQYLFDKSQLNMKGLELNIAAVGEQLPLGKIQIDLTTEAIVLNPDRRSVSLKGLVLMLDDNRLTGDINVSDYAQPALSFKLASDNLDVDALLGTPPVQPGPAPEAEAEVAGASEEDVQISLPMELLRTIGIDGVLAVKQLKIQNLFLNDIDLGISAKSGVVNLDPIKMNLYDGSFSGKVRLDARSDLPRYRVSKNLQGVQIGKLLIDYMGEDRIIGALNANADITTHGDWLSELKKNSNGNMKLAFKDGAVNGFNLRYSIDKAKAKLKGQTLPSEEGRQTDFSSLTLSGQIKDGIFSSNDLSLQAPVIRVGGEGQANLNDNTVDYLVRAKLVGTTKGQDGGGVDDLAGLLIPVRIVGPFADPKIDVQYDEMLKGQLSEKAAAAKEKLKAEIAEQKEALQKKINEEKAKLEETRKLEIENEKKVLEAKAKAKAEEAKKKLLDKLF